MNSCHLKESLFVGLIKKKGARFLGGKSDKLFSCLEAKPPEPPTKTLPPDPVEMETAFTVKNIQYNCRITNPVFQQL